MHPIDIAKSIRLPPQLENHEYLRPFYGNVEWSSKGVFSNYMGWFSGDPVDLNPYSPKEKAKRMIELGNGRDNILLQARHALENEVYPISSQHVLLNEQSIQKHDCERF